MTIVNGLIWGLLLWGGQWVHPFHVSICEIEYEEDSKSLEITHRIFADDLEAVWDGTKDIQGLFTNGSKDERADALLSNYLAENFTLRVNSKPIAIEYLGYEIEEDVVWVYLEAKKVKKIQSLIVKNTVLLNQFDDQTNFVHFDYLGKTNSLKLSPDQSEDELVFDH